MPEVGRRPACILTRNAAIPVLRSLLVAPATRRIRRIPTEVLLGPEDGMPEECALSLDNVTIVPKALLVERIAALPAHRLEEVCRALQVATGCAP